MFHHAIFMASVFRHVIRNRIKCVPVLELISIYWLMSFFLTREFPTTYYCTYLDLWTRLIYVEFYVPNIRSCKRFICRIVSFSFEESQLICFAFLYFYFTFLCFAFLCLAMTSTWVTFLLFFIVRMVHAQDLRITVVVNADSTNAVELTACSNIPDLSLYFLFSTAFFQFPNGSSAVAGQHIYVANDIINFTAFYGFAPDFTSSIAF